MTTELPVELHGLTSGSPSERAAAAAWLIQNPDRISTRSLVNALQNETVPRVRRILLKALDSRQIDSRVSNPESEGAQLSRQKPGPDVVPSVSRDYDTAAMVRHELSPAVGWLRLAADKDIKDFKSSNTNEAIGKLQRRIDGLVAIIKSSQELDIRQHNLIGIVENSWPHAEIDLSISSATHKGSVDIETDEGMMTILLSNVFQNSIDASLEALQKIDVQVIWGCTDLNYWVRVTNRFDGDRFSLSDVLSVGNSSKVAHQGHGMSLIAMLAHRLGLDINLEGVSGLASFTMIGALPND